MARPRIDVTDEQIAEIETLAGFGLTQDQIADALGFSARTLRNRLKDDERVVAAYKRGRGEFGRVVGGKLRDLIMDPTHKGHTAAVIFALKCQFGWKETQGIDLSADLPELRFVLEKDES